MKRISILMILVAALFLHTDAFGKKTFDSYVCKKDKIEFDDGDTISCGDENIRFLGIDTPEISHPGHGIANDQPMGREAAAFTKDTITNAKRVVIVPDGKDPYDRTLAYILVDGELLGMKLIKAGLAYETVSRYGDNGMPEFALQITEAWKSVDKPSFDDPHKWRKKNQKKTKK